MTDKRETPLARWSRLKRADTEVKPLPTRDDQIPETAPAPRQQTEIVPPENDSEVSSQAHDDTAADVDLPDIADLNAESDYSAFLREEVSEEIRRKALRVLWRSDPVLANLDGLNDYDEDFRSAGVLAEAVRTAYKVGKGYLREEDKRPTSEDEATPQVNEAAEEEGTGAKQPETETAGPTDSVGSLDPSGENPEAGGESEKKS